MDNKEEDATTNNPNGGIKEGVQSGLEAAQENIDEFNRILNGEESSNSETKD